MTIEIALLMPILIGVFLFLFFTSYYLHDAVAYEKACNTSLIRGALAKPGNGSKDMEKAFEEIRLLGNWESERSFFRENILVRVNIDGIMDAPEGLFKKLIRKEYKLRINEVFRCIDEVTYIRKSKGSK